MELKEIPAERMEMMDTRFLFCLLLADSRTRF